MNRKCRLVGCLLPMQLISIFKMNRNACLLFISDRKTGKAGGILNEDLFSLSVSTCCLDLFLSLKWVLIIHKHMSIQQYEYLWIR